MRLLDIALIAIPLSCAIGAGLWLWTPDRPRAVLEAKYLDAPGDIVELLGTRLHVRDSGPEDAPPILMLHGFGSSLHTWEPWAQALAKDHRVIRLDLPGSGLSAPDASGNYSDERTMDLLAALLDRLGLDRASLVGNSIGGRIAWKFAALKPERVAKLVLISPDGFASAGFSYGERPSVPAVIKLMRYVLPKALVRRSIAPAYGDPKNLTGETVDRYYDLMLAPGVRDAMIARMEQTVLEDPEPLLKRIRSPTLLIWGEKDAMIPLANARDYLRNLPDAELATFPELGHVPQEEAPARSLSAVKSFLAP